MSRFPGCRLRSAPRWARRTRRTGPVKVANRTLESSVELGGDRWCSYVTQRRTRLGRFPEPDATGVLFRRPELCQATRWEPEPIPRPFIWATDPLEHWGADGRNDPSRP